LSGWLSYRLLHGDTEVTYTWPWVAHSAACAGTAVPMETAPAAATVAAAAIAARTKPRLLNPLVRK
jgi:hypothetical protein